MSGSTKSSPDWKDAEMFKLKQFTWIFVLYPLLLSPKPSLAQTPCLDFLNPTTIGLLSYLELLLEKNEIGEREIERIIQRGNTGDFQNPILEREAELSSTLYEHYLGVEEYRGRRDLSLNRILRWAAQKLDKEKKEKTERSRIKGETQDPHSEIKFFPIPSGEFKIKKTHKKSIHLTHPFEAMSTEVTQKQWVELMGKNPSFFSNGVYRLALEVNDNLITLQPDHPVENISWWSTLVFANRLSEKDGLKPAYDLSDIQWKKGTSAEEGTLEAISGTIKLNSTDGTYYGVEGYRLPTEAEQVYLLRGTDASQTTPLYSLEEITDYAWCVENTGGTTHPVGLLLPTIINGSAFYDLYGNVWEWAWDWQGALKSGVNPTGPKTGERRILRGGAINYDAELVLREFRNSESPNRRDRTQGFRLVKTRHIEN